MVKTSSKLGLKENFLTVVKDIYKEPKANIMCYLEILKNSPMKSGQTRMSTVFNSVLSANAVSMSLKGTVIIS